MYTTSQTQSWLHCRCNYFINLDIVAEFRFAAGYYLVLFACFEIKRVYNQTIPSRAIVNAVQQSKESER